MRYTIVTPRQMHRKLYGTYERYLKVWKKKGIKCEIEMPKYKGEHITMWKLIPLKLMPPTRRVRYCCQVLKEAQNTNRYIATGVRWAESRQRKEREEFEKIGATKATKEKFTSIMLMNDNDANRRMNELCMQKNEMVVNPIIDWKDSDIWEFINSEHIETCELYKCGYDRVGYVGCPMAGKKRYKEFADFPKYKQSYIRAFERMLDVRKEKGLGTQWKTGEDVFRWWMNDDNLDGQMELSDFIEY